MYTIKGKTVKISATSRSSVKIKDNYYTVEMTEERSIPDIEGIDLAEEKRALFDSINATIDNQIEDIVNSFR